MSNEEVMLFLRKNAISVTCVILSIAMGVVWYMRSDLLPEAEKVLADKQQQGELLAANIEDAHLLEEQHAAIVASNQAITDRVLRVGQLAENQQYFYRLESETNTKLVDLRPIPWSPPGKNAPKTNFTTVSFALSVQGEYAQLMDLLRKLETGEHYCRVTSCTVHPLTEMRGGQLGLTLNLDLLAEQ